MSKFTVAPMLDNSRTRRIGYQVISRPAAHGARIHDSKQGKPVLVNEMDSEGLASAKIAMEARAAFLNDEADANRARA